MLTNEDLQIIKNEEDFLNRVKKSILTSQGKKIFFEDYKKQLEYLQEALKTVKNEDVASIYSEYHLLHSKAMRSNNSQNLLPSIDSPYFAHMRLLDEKGERDILLGHISYINTKDNVVIINWKDAPISRIFFSCKEGEDFEEDLPDNRIISGTLILRRVLTIFNGELLGIQLPNISFTKNKDKTWKKSELIVPNLSGGENTATRGYLGTGMTGAYKPEVSSLLDNEQYEILHLEEETPLLILGGAGSGKTTVALHRLATLTHKNPKKYSQNKIVSIVPEKGLVKLSKKILSNLGITQVEVATFDHWVAKQARRVSQNLPRKICDSTPLQVIKFKRHPKILKLIPKYVKLEKEEICKRLSLLFPETTKFLDFFQSLANIPLDKSLDRTENYVLNNIPGKHLDSKIEKIKKYFAEEKMRLYNLSRDRELFFSNRNILNEMIGDDITQSTISDVILHTNKQLEEKEKKYKDFDNSKLETLDGKDIDYMTPDDVAQTIDAEDFPILLEILFEKTNSLLTPKGEIKKYNHMVLDEAQELNPIELTTLKRSLNNNPSITIAGDAAQQTDPTSSFTNWEKILKDLDKEHSISVHLNTSYRSPRPIAEFAHNVLGIYAPKVKPKIIKDGYPVTITDITQKGHMSVLLSDTLSDLQDKEPNATVAIIVRENDSALFYYDMVKNLPKTRLVLDGEFSFTSGIDVTTVKQIKGLEFDYVIIPDANSITYNTSYESRRNMHVAATRAIHQLWVLSIGKRSKILPEV